MTISEKAKKRLDTTTQELKENIDNLKNEISELTAKIKDKLKGTGSEVRESAEELSRELKNLSEKVKNIIPKRKKSRLPVRIEKPNEVASGTWLQPFSDLQRATDRLFNEFAKTMGFPSLEIGESPVALTGYEWPRVDISETDDNIQITADLPGVDKDDVEISIRDNTITIRGEKKQEEEEKGEGFYKIERSYGTFQRSFYLPSEIEEDKVEASFKDGVLKITLPKTEAAKAKTKQIPINQG